MIGSLVDLVKNLLDMWAWGSGEREGWGWEKGERLESFYIVGT